MGYARLGALHHISPYTHGISSEHFDPIFQFASWDNLKSPYGELFTALSYPLAFLSLPVAFWVIKVWSCCSASGSCRWSGGVRSSSAAIRGSWSGSSR